jgi:hypothetical protein
MASRLAANLLQAAKVLAERTLGVAKDLAPAHIAPHIKASVSGSGETVVMALNVNPQDDPAEKYGTADARAQEFGSGLHAQIGETGFIRIVAQNAEALVFEGTNEYEGQTIVMMKPRPVYSPGIKAVNDGQGYMRLAIQQAQTYVEVGLDPVIRDEVDFTTRITFSHAKKWSG